MTDKSGNGKVLTGKVVSNAMTGVVVVDIERKKTHRLYGKSYSVNTRIKAKTDKNFEIGDIVSIAETRPMSKDVAFKVLENKK